MARVCQFCGKGTKTGGSIARRGLPKKKGGVGLRTTGHTLRKFRPNLQRVRAQVDRTVQRIKLCTRCLRAGKVRKAARKLRSA